MNNLIQDRRSIRSFNAEKPVTKEQLKKILEAAMLAPSACNTRPWEFIVITNREILTEVRGIIAGAKMLDTAAAAIVVVAIPQEGKAEGYFPQDCGAATQNILLEAVSLGLGACWCGVFPREERVNALTELLKIEKPKIPLNVIAIGYPAESPLQKGFFDETKVTFFV